jgi:hypothetical protein
MATRWGGSVVTAAITTGRTGSNGLQVSASSGTNMARLLSSSQEHATLILGAAVNLKSASNSVSFVFRSDNNATTHVTVVISAADGTIRVYRGTSGGTQLGIASAVVSGADTWNSLECKVTLSDTVGVIQVKWNGTTVISLINQDTKNAGTKTTFDAVGILGGAGSTVIDDFIILNGAGSVSNDFMGDARIRALSPSGAGATTGLTVQGVAANYQNVDELPPSTTDYNYGDTGTEDTYAFGDVPTLGQIAGVQVSLYAAKDATGAKSLAPVVRAGGTDYEGTAQSLSQGYGYLMQQYSTNPATGSAWTPSDVNAAEFGAKVEA